jgi:hypothetical protein
VRGDPLEDVSVLLDRDSFALVMKNGKRVPTARRTYDPKRVSDFSLAAWNELYTQERVRELGATRPEPARPAASRPRVAL